MGANDGKPGSGAGSGDGWLDRRDNRHRVHGGRGPSGRERAREDLLAVWYGEDAARLEVAARMRPAVPVRDAVAGVFKRFGLQANLDLDDLQAAWPRLVGPDIARNSRPYSLQNGVLLVEATDSTWCYVLETQHRRDILAQVQAFASGKVRQVRFIAAGRRAPVSRPPFRTGDPGGGAGGAGRRAGTSQPPGRPTRKPDGSPGASA